MSIYATVRFALNWESGIRKKKALILLANFKESNPYIFSYEFRDIRTEYLWGTIGEIRSKMRQFETTD